MFQTGDAEEIKTLVFFF